MDDLACIILNTLKTLNPLKRLRTVPLLLLHIGSTYLDLVWDIRVRQSKPYCRVYTCIFQDIFVKVLPKIVH